jgi:hypothetical protein
MQKIILIAVLFCASASFAQTPFDSFDTTMKSVPIFKSNSQEIYRLSVETEQSYIKYIILDAENKLLKYYNSTDSLVAKVYLKPNSVKFLSVDPLTNKYPMLTPYQFASNTPIQAIDLDGLEAWKITKQWEPSDIKNFATYAETQIKKAVANKIKEDCANFALRLLVGYASENGLPLTLKNSSTSFDASSTQFKTTNQYLSTVKANIQAKDIPLNTYNIQQNETQAGDMEAMHFTKNNGKKVNFNHVVVFQNYNTQNPMKSTIAWGNLNSATDEGTAVTSQNYNWVRSSTYNDGVNNQFTIFSGSMNARWNVLNPVNLPQQPATTPAPATQQNSDSSSQQQPQNPSTPNN